LETTYEQDAEENSKILGVCVMKEEKNYRIGLYRSAKNHRLIEGCVCSNVSKTGNECTYEVIRRLV
jgi:hypothetical protein